MRATGVLRGALTGGLLLVALGSTACKGESTPTPTHLTRYSSGAVACNTATVLGFGREMSMAEYHRRGCPCAVGVGPLGKNHYHERVLAWPCPDEHGAIRP